MNFRIGWMGRLLLALLFLGGCYTHRDVAVGAPIMDHIHTVLHDQWRPTIAAYPFLEELIIDNMTLHHGCLPLGSMRNGNLFDSPLAQYDQNDVRLCLRCFGDDWAGRAVRDAGYQLQFRLVKVDRPGAPGLKHVPYEYTDQADLVTKLAALRQSHVEAVRKSVEGAK